jgi:hypothetical protein
MSSSDPWNAHNFLVLSTSSQFSFFLNVHYDDVILGGKRECLGEWASKRGSKDSFWEWGRKGMIGGIERWLVGGWEQGFLNILNLIKFRLSSLYCYHGALTHLFTWLSPNPSVDSDSFLHFLVDSEDKSEGTMRPISFITKQHFTICTK